MNGEQIPFGSEVYWEFSRQMNLNDFNSVDSTLSFSHGLLITAIIFITILVLSGGSLIPVWMFINSLQLCAYVVLIPTKLPGNAHHFLLNHLEILRLHFFGLGEWLSSLSNTSKYLDAQQALDEQVEYYTPLLYTCGYSFSLLPNLILVIFLFGLIGVICMLLWATDLLLRYICKKKTDQPRLTNIAIRFLYEVYFEICLSVMIFASFMDFDDSSSH